MGMNPHTVRLVCLFAFCFPVLSSLAQNKKSDLAERQIWGNVISVHETFYKAILRNGIADTGKRVNDKLFDETYSVYDDAGMEATQILFGPSGDTLNQTLKYYDALMNLSAVEIIYQDKAAQRVQYACSYAGGRLNEVTWLNPVDSVRGRETYAYDSSGNVSDKSWYYPDSIPWKRQTWMYDSRGLVTETVRYGKNGKVQARHVYVNDDIGRLTEETVTDGKGKFLVHLVYSYNEKGFPAAELQLNKKGKEIALTTWEYTLDESGNWTRRVAYKGKKPWMITIRKISYN